MIIFRRTLREILRARTMTAFGAFVILLAWAAPFAGSLAYESGAAISVDLGIAAATVFAALVSILLGYEVAGGAARPVFHPLLAAGLRRERLFAERWLATALAGAVLAALPPITLWSVCRIAGGPYALAARDLAGAAVLLPLEAVLLVSITSAFATAWPGVTGLSLAFTIWLAAHMHPDPLTWEILYPGWSGSILRSVSRLAPDLEIYNPRLHDPSHLLTLLSALLQSAAYSTVAVLAAIAALRRRDL